MNRGVKPPRRLNADEAALWARVARTATPLDGRRYPPLAKDENARETPKPAPFQPKAVQAPPASPPPAPRPAASPRPLDRHGLDASWERKLARGLVQPDATLDLHGASLDAAHARLDNGLSQAKAMGARLVLVITGRPRPAEPGERGNRRGAIRAKIVDWLAAGGHAFDIAAIRGAHRRHGGPGALYIVLKRNRA